MIRYFLLIIAIATSSCRADTTKTYLFNAHRDTNEFTPSRTFSSKNQSDVLVREAGHRGPSKDIKLQMEENQSSKKGMNVSTEASISNNYVPTFKNLTLISINACDQNYFRQENNAEKCASTSLEKLAPIASELNQRHSLSDRTPAKAMKNSVILLSLSGDMKQAYQVSNKRRDLKNTFWHILSEIGSVEDLYLYTIKESPATIQSLPIRTKRKVIDRLIRSSAPNVAQKWMTGNLSASLRTRYLKYMISGTSYENLEATDIVTGYLLSMANQGAGNIEESFKWLNAQNFPPELRYSEKLLGNPQPDDPTAWGELSRKIETPVDIERMPQLQASRNLIENSQATRQSLTSLLAETSTVPQPQGSGFEFAD